MSNINNFAKPATKAGTSSKVTSRQPTVPSSSSGIRAFKKERSVPKSTIKDRNAGTRPKFNANTTVLGVLGHGDSTISGQGSEVPDFEAAVKFLEHNSFLRALLEDCLVENKCERETTEIDVQLTHLAKRFEQTAEQLDKTNRRMKEIAFVAEQKRLMDLKKQDCSKLYELTDNSDAKELLINQNTVQQSSLDRLQTKNVDFGYDKDSGHKQLLDAVNDAINGLEEIRKYSDLDLSKFKEYESTQENLDNLEKSRKDLENLKKEFEEKFPEFSEQLLKEMSETLSKIVDSEDEDE